MKVYFERNVIEIANYFDANMSDGAEESCVDCIEVDSSLSGDILTISLTYLPYNSPITLMVSSTI